MASLGDIHFTTKLSSAGLTYLHFGREVRHSRRLGALRPRACPARIRPALTPARSPLPPTCQVLKTMLPAVSDKDRETLYKTMYENFMEEIDAIDNGVSQYASGSPR